MNGENDQRRLNGSNRPKDDGGTNFDELICPIPALVDLLFVREEIVDSLRNCTIAATGSAREGGEEVFVGGGAVAQSTRGKERKINKWKNFLFFFEWSTSGNWARAFGLFKEIEKLKI